MVERRTNVSQFAGVSALQKDIERLTKERDALAKERENSQTKLLEEHSESLAELKTSLALIVDRTKNLPTSIQEINWIKVQRLFTRDSDAVTTSGPFWYAIP